MNEKKWPYEDIVNLPHHVSQVHPPMPMENRAAQFAPFSALTGYNEAVAESARLTDNRIELSDTVLEELDRKMEILPDTEVKIIYFEPDKRKNGGAYRELTGKIRKLEMGEIVMESGLRIPARDVVDIRTAD